MKQNAESGEHKGKGGNNMMTYATTELATSVLPKRKPLSESEVESPEAKAGVAVFCMCVCVCVCWCTFQCVYEYVCVPMCVCVWDLWCVRVCAYLLMHECACICDILYLIWSL